MFEQLLSYLDAKPLPASARSFPKSGQEGVAAAALCLRWGSYFAVLADQTKPLWSQANTKENRDCISRISDSEIARINIEASAAMAAWVDIFRSDLHGRYSELVAKALAYIPMPQQKVPANRDNIFHSLALPQFRTHVMEWLGPQRTSSAMSELAPYASRVFGNALVNYAWRNGPVESVHAGQRSRDLPLDQCRITTIELRDLMRYSAARFQAGMAACLSMYYETPSVTWPEQVLPFSQAKSVLITPSGWTLDESCREVRDFFSLCDSTVDNGA
jgi:hypothetical protein